MRNCYESAKICFRSEKKANEFIMKYEEDILSKNGYAPVRAYYSESEQSWQVTSRYNITSEYMRDIMFFYESTTGKRLPRKHTYQQHDKHVENAMLYFVDTKICEVARIMLNCSDKEATYDIMKDIRMAYSQCAYRKETRNDAHKAKIARFIAFWSRWNLGEIAEPKAISNTEKALSYFSKKCGSFSKRQFEDDEEILQAKNLLSECIDYIIAAHKCHQAGDVEKGLEWLDSAKGILDELSLTAVLSYKKKEVMAMWEKAYDMLTLCQGVA